MNSSEQFLSLRHLRLGPSNDGLDFYFEQRRNPLKVSVVLTSKQFEP